MAALDLHPDRLFPADTGTRDVARRLYATVKHLPIVSPHGHTDPQWFADDEPFADASRAAHHARPLRVPHALQPGHRARGPRHPARATAARSRRDRAQDLAHVRRALSPVPRHAVAAVARPRVRHGVRHRRAARRHDSPTGTSTTSTTASARPEFRPRALFERFNIEVLATTESPLDPLTHHRKIRDVGLEGPGDHRLPARPRGRSGVRRVSATTSRGWARSRGEDTATGAAISPRIATAAHFFKSTGRDVDRPWPSHRAHVRLRRRANASACSIARSSARSPPTRPRRSAARC